MCILSFFRIGLGFVFMAPWLIRTRLQGLKTTKTSWFLARAFATTIGSLGFFYALGEIPLADAVAIMFTRPLYGTVFAIVFLGEIVGQRRWAALGIGFLGVLVMVRPGFEAVNLGLAAVFVASIRLGNADMGTDRLAVVHRVGRDPGSTRDVARIRGGGRIDHTADGFLAADNRRPFRFRPVFGDTLHLHRAGRCPDIYIDRLYRPARSPKIA